MRIYTKIILYSLLPLTLLADCELLDDSKTQAYNQFIEAQTLNSDEKYAQAYEMLKKSLQTYSPKSTEIALDYECVNFIPGPYAPIIQKSTKTEDFDFDRTTLGKEIKRQLSPAPYVFIEFQKAKTIVSVLNSEKTSRTRLSTRLPLENFVVRVDNESADFPRIEVGQTQQKVFFSKHTPSSNIKTEEEFDFKLYK